MSKYGRIPHLTPDSYLLRPEDKNNRFFRRDPWEYAIQQAQEKRIKGRFKDFTDYFFRARACDEQFHRYSQRLNFQSLFYVFMSGQVLGFIVYYLNHKIRVIEPHMVEEYGRDYPAYVTPLYHRLYYEWRIKLFYFQLYNLQYYVDEQ